MHTGARLTPGRETRNNAGDGHKRLRRNRKDMNRLITSLALALAVVAAQPAPMAAQNTAQIYAVHGVPGAVGFPVDIQVTDLGGGAPLCLDPLKGVTFGEVIGPLALPKPGMYKVEVFAANAIAPCTGMPILMKDVQLTADIDSASVVAHLSETGTPMISVFVNDVSPTGRGEGRIIAHHTAQAPPVDIVVTSGSARARGRVPTNIVEKAANGAQAAVPVRPGNPTVYLALDATDSDTIALGPVRLPVRPYTAYLVYAIGEAGSSLTVAVKEITGLK